MSIDEKIKKVIENELVPCLSDEHWCWENGINHVNPNVPEAREKIYNELLEFVKWEYEQKTAPAPI